MSDPSDAPAGELAVAVAADHQAVLTPATDASALSASGPVNTGQLQHRQSWETRTPLTADLLFAPDIFGPSLVKRAGVEESRVLAGIRFDSSESRLRSQSADAGYMEMRQMMLDNSRQLISGGGHHNGNSVNLHHEEEDVPVHEIISSSGSSSSSLISTPPIQLRYPVYREGRDRSLSGPAFSNHSGDNREGIGVGHDVGGGVVSGSFFEGHWGHSGNMYHNERSLITHFQNNSASSSNVSRAKSFKPSLSIDTRFGDSGHSQMMDEDEVFVGRFQNQYLQNFQASSPPPLSAPYSTSASSHFSMMDASSSADFRGGSRGSVGSDDSRYWYSGPQSAPPSLMSLHSAASFSPPGRWSDQGFRSDHHVISVETRIIAGWSSGLGTRNTPPGEGMWQPIVPMPLSCGTSTSPSSHLSQPSLFQQQHELPILGGRENEPMQEDRNSLKISQSSHSSMQQYHSPYPRPPPIPTSHYVGRTEEEIRHRELALEVMRSRGLNPEPNTICLSPPEARYFVIKSFTEDDVFKSIKYGIWSSTEIGNRRLNQAFIDSERRFGMPVQKARPSQPQPQSGSLLAPLSAHTYGPIILLFSVNASGHFCGVARMVSPLDWGSSSTVWSQNMKWKGVFSCKWIFCKDIPNQLFRHLKVPANENKPVTNSRDTQEVPLEVGAQVMKIFSEFKPKTCLVDDWWFYEIKEKEESAK